MNYYQLDEDEQRELDEFERALDAGALKSELTPARKREIEQAARNTLNKTKNINIRLSERDLHKLKTKAIEEGIPYQTLASSILHKKVAEVSKR
jgi:predicted DNA binding CopG/RHH family protein